MALPLPDLVEEVEGRLVAMGYELVEARWVGSPRRPVLRIKMDLPDSVPGQGGVTVDQCAEVSRALEPWLDDHPEIPERYVLEVSSPGVERPLTKAVDWDRFRGQPVLVKGKGFPDGVGNRVEGEILGLEEPEGTGPRVAILLPTGERVLIPMDGIQKAHLLFRWD